MSALEPSATVTTWDARAACRRYALAALGCALFAAVYEHFSHEVYSPFMIGAFAWPLACGTLPAFVVARAGIPVLRGSGLLLACAVLTLTFGSVVTGVFEIYGTTSPYTAAYWVLGTALLACAVVAELVGRRP